MSLRKKLILKSIIETIIEFTFILGFALLLGKPLEAIIIIISFLFFRYKHEKQYHSYYCLIVSIVIISILTLLNLPTNQSVFMSICLSFILTRGSFFTRDYIDITKPRKMKLYKGISRQDFNRITSGLDNDIGL